MGALSTSTADPTNRAGPRASSPTRIALEAVLVLVGYTAAAVAVTWPIARDLSSTVLGVVDSDSAGGIWWLDAVQAHGYRLVGSTRFTEIAFPAGVEQPNALNLQWLVPYFPAYLATKLVGAVVAFNLTLISGFALSGAAMYLLARRLGVARGVAAWAGLAFLAFPWHVERAVAGHASLVHLECFPLLALALLALAERRSALRLALVGGAVALCWLTSGYYGVMALVVVPVATLAGTVAARAGRRGLGTAGLATGIAVAVSAAVFVVSLAGAGGDTSVGTVRQATDLDRYGLRPLELVVPPPASPLLRRVAPGFWESRKHDSNIQEISNYLGWVTLGLAVAWIVVAVGRRATLAPSLRAVTGGAVATAAAAFVLALPGSFTLLGVHVPATPSRALFEVVPVFRVPTRWTTVLVLATVILATLGLQAVVDRLARARLGRPRLLAAGAVVLALAATWTELRISHPGVVYDPGALPAEYAILDRVAPGALAEYPLASSESSTTSAYLLRQRLHGRPLLNGAAPGTAAEDVRRALVDPAAPGVAAELAARGIVAVVTRPDTISRALDVDVPARAPRLGDGFALVGTTPDGASVWRVTAAPAPASARLDGDGFAAPVLSSGGRVVQPLRGPVGSLSIVARRPLRATLRVALESVGGETRRVRVGATTVRVGARPVTVELPLSLPAGQTVVPVSVVGGAPGVVDVAASAPTLVPRAPTRG